MSEYFETSLSEQFVNTIEKQDVLKHATGENHTIKTMLRPNRLRHLKNHSSNTLMKATGNLSRWNIIK
jgi:hypothetical protein